MENRQVSDAERLRLSAEAEKAFDVERAMSDGFIHAKKTLMDAKIRLDEAHRLANDATESLLAAFPRRHLHQEPRSRDPNAQETSVWMMAYQTERVLPGKDAADAQRAAREAVDAFRKCELVK